MYIKIRKKKGESYFSFKNVLEKQFPQHIKIVRMISLFIKEDSPHQETGRIFPPNTGGYIKHGRSYCCNLG
ncbi:MAG: hypothetical protein K0R46_2428 [Herbinix sp.]|jgi:hypothetical protein|nr:hypothetical protein [Herbinix sp.]